MSLTDVLREGAGRGAKGKQTLNATYSDKCDLPVNRKR